MVFSFSTAPVVQPKAKKRRRKLRAAKPVGVKTITKIRASVRECPSSKAGVVKLMAMIIDPLTDVDEITTEQFAKRRKDRLKKALECLEIYDNFLTTKPPPTTKVILRRGRKPLFRRG